MLRRRITRIGSVAAMLLSESWTIDDMGIKMVSALDGLAGPSVSRPWAVCVGLLKERCRCQPPFLLGRIFSCGRLNI